MNATTWAPTSPNVHPINSPRATCPQSHTPPECSADRLPSLRSPPSRYPSVAPDRNTAATAGLSSPICSASIPAAAAAMPAIVATARSAIVPTARPVAMPSTKAMADVVKRKAAILAMTRAAPTGQPAMQLNALPKSRATRWPMLPAAVRRMRARGRPMCRRPAGFIRSPRGLSFRRASSRCLTAKANSRSGWQAFAA
jgi:hypothetical protein